MELKQITEMIETARPCHSIHCRHWGLADGLKCYVEVERLIETDHIRQIKEKSRKFYTVDDEIALRIGDS